MWFILTLFHGLNLEIEKNIRYELQQKTFRF